MIEVVEIEGDVFYFKDGLLHRDGYPAIEFKSGDEWWIDNGMIHRENGPAIIHRKDVEYWVNDHRASKEEKKNIKRNYWIDKYEEL